MPDALLAKRRRPMRYRAMLALALPAGLAAQHPNVFRGQVFDSAGTALANVQVTIAEAHRETRTDARGIFVFHDVSAGFYHVSLREPGFRPIAGTARIAADDSIDLKFWMKPAVVELDTVRVAQRNTADPLADFKRRMATGNGTFIVEARLDQLQDWPLAQVIRSQTTRVRIVQLPSGGWALVSERPAGCLLRSCGTPLCYMAVWLDGIRIFPPGDPPDLSEYRVADLTGVEIYPGVAETPVELNAIGSTCGTIALWTKMGTRAANRE